MAMNKILVIHFLLMFFSLATFGQDATGFRAKPNVLYGIKDLPLPESKNQSKEKDPRVIIDTDATPNFDQADPRMPIMVPPKDVHSKFPIKNLPKDFPSNMPIYGPKEKSADLKGKNPSIKPRH